MPIPTPINASRPIFFIDGEQSPGLVEALLSLRVEEDTNASAACEVTFVNWGPMNGEVGYVYFDRQVIDFGRTLTVAVGHGPESVEIFSGRITAIQGRYPRERPPELLVIAQDRLMDLGMVRRSRTFQDRTDADVIAQIAGEHGLLAEVDVDGLHHELLAQVNQTDLEFLRQRVGAIDADLWIEDGVLRAQARSRRASSHIDLAYGSALREFHVTADLSGQRTSVTVAGWEPKTKGPIREQSTETAIQPELNGGHSGSHILDETFGARPDYVVDGGPLSDEEAKTLADARFRQMARRFVHGHAVADGDGRIRVGTKVSLQCLGALFDGDYTVSAVKHAFDTTAGFLTFLEVERPGLGGA